jgi:hypothetical protein
MIKSTTLVLILSALLSGCNGYGSHDRREFNSLKEQVTELKGLLFEKDAVARISQGRTRIESDASVYIAAPIVIGTQESREQELLLKVHRNSFAIAKRVVKIKYPNAADMMPSKPESIEVGIIRQKVHFRDSHYNEVVGVVELDYRVDPPYLNSFSIHREGRSELIDFDGYKLVPNDRNR